MPCPSVFPEVHVQNAALAGGVVVGTSAEMMLTPFGALAAGFLAGTVSTLGFKFFTVQMPLGPWTEQRVFGPLPPTSPTGLGWERGRKTHYWCPVLQPILESKFKIQDTCGVHNLHGMPGVLGALLGVLVAGLATHDSYGEG